MICEAMTYPTALYMWKGTDGNIFYSQVNDAIANNGTYYCMAYFDRASSNYTGNVSFRNGTGEKTVTECCKYRPESLFVLIAYAMNYLV